MKVLFESGNGLRKTSAARAYKKEGVGKALEGFRKKPAKDPIKEGRHTDTN